MLPSKHCRSKTGINPETKGHPHASSPCRGDGGPTHTKNPPVRSKTIQAQMLSSSVVRIAVTLLCKKMGGAGGYLCRALCGSLTARVAHVCPGADPGSSRVGRPPRNKQDAQDAPYPSDLTIHKSQQRGAADPGGASSGVGRQGSLHTAFRHPTTPRHQTLHLFVQQKPPKRSEQRNQTLRLG